MAEKDKNKISFNLDFFSKSNEKIDKTLFGVEKDLIASDKKEKDDLENIANLLTKVKRNDIGLQDGDNIVSLLLSMNSNTSGKQLQLKEKNDGNNLARNVSRILDSPENLNLVNQLFMQERNRLIQYQNYQQVNELIPQVCEAIKTYVDNIISPDDFTKQSLNLSYDDPNIGAEKLALIDSNINILRKQYNLDLKVTNYVNKALYLGDHFVAILKISEELNKMILKEDSITVPIIDSDGNVYKNNLKTRILTKNDIIINETELGILTESSNNSEQILDTVKQEISDYLMEQFEVTDNISLLLEENAEMEEDFGSPISEASAYESKNVNNIIVTRDIPKVNATQATSSNYRMDDSSSKSTNTDLEINGSIVKELEPSRVIKLSSNGICYGYYYLDITNEALASSVMPSRTALINTTNYLNQLPSGDMASKSKSDVMYELLFKNLTQKINKKFVKNNPEFKQVIYNVLKLQDAYQKKIRIIYLRPEQVVHFKPNVDENAEYGKSLYYDIMFTAKLYIATLTSMLMIKVTRSSDKRIFYIETGLEAKYEETIQNVIRDYKTKDVNMYDFDEINTIFKVVSKFDDMFVPTFDGAKPIEIDTIQGQEVNIEDDFLQYLLKTLISGMGTPPAHLSYVEDIELVKTLAMLNGKFLRRVISLQSAFEPAVTKLLRALYNNEFCGDNKEIVDIKHLIAKFPSPATLNQTNLLDQINNGKEIVDFICQTYCGQSYTDNVTGKEFYKEMCKNIMVSIDWTKYDDIFTNVKQRVAIEKQQGNKDYLDEDELAALDSNSMDDNDEEDTSSEDYGEDSEDFGSEDIDNPGENNSPKM